MPIDTSPRFTPDIASGPRTEVDGLLRQWLDPADYASCEVAILAGGAVNQNFRIEHADGRRSVLRLAPPPPTANALGVDMVNSIRVAKLAGEAGAGPAVLGSREPQGDSLIEFLDGMLDVGTIHRPETIAAIGDAIRKIHELPSDGVRAKTTFEDIDDWLAGAREQGVEMEAEMTAISAQLQTCREIFDRIEGSCVCHRDINPQNCAFDGDTAQIIDWDFSGVDTPYLDLTMLINYAELDQAETEILVRAAIGEPDQADMARIRILELGNSVREWAWCLNAAKRLEGQTNTLTEYLPDGGEGHSNFYAGYAAVNWKRIEKISADPRFDEDCRVAAADLPAPGHR